MPKKLTTEEFIERAKKKHGDRYGYEKVEYINYDIKVTIICNIHKDFEQTPNGHLQGQGCPDCSIECVAKSRTKTTEYFIEKAKEKHGDRYGYEKVEYKHSLTKVTITCPSHGVFDQTPNSHMQGQGCPKCIGSTTEEFIKKAVEVHGNRYTYENVKYVHYRIKLIITCPIHGDFEQLPDNHLQGQGCPKGKMLTTEEFIKKAVKLYGDCYRYEKVKYVNSRTIVTITCLIHGDFEQTPNNHMQGRGCPRRKISIGEAKVKRFLDNNNIRHVQEYVLPGRRYRFDFYLPEYLTFIEFNGAYHYEETAHIFANGQDKYEKLAKVQLSDAIKKEFCEQNDLGLIIVKHDVKDINQFLTEQLNKGNEDGFYNDRETSLQR